MSVKSWRHSAHDGRGPRAVFLDGARLERVVYADERRGVVKVVPNPFRVSKRGNVITRVQRGRVEVRPL